MLRHYWNYRKIQLILAAAYTVGLTYLIAATSESALWLVGWGIYAISVLLQDYLSYVKVFRLKKDNEALHASIATIKLDGATAVEDSKKMYEYWYGRYVDLRQDRLAVLQALGAVFPIGVREESQLIDTPLNYNECFYGNGFYRQTFLYMDYEFEGEAQQLRIRLAPNELAQLRSTGQFPEYTGQRRSWFEEESREIFRRYLIQEATALLREDAKIAT